MKNDKNGKLLLWVVLFGILWTKAATLLSIPFLTLFLYKNTHLSIFAIGIIVGLQPLALCLGSTIGGYLADIFKIQTVMLYSILMSCFVFFGFYFTSKYLMYDAQIIAFALLNLLNGVGIALYSPVSRAMISSMAKTSEENTRFLHLRYFAINVGAALGPLVGAYAGVAANEKAFLITALLYLFYLIFLFFSLKNYHNPKKILVNENNINFVDALKKIVENKPFMGLLISLTIFNLSYVQLSSNLALLINNAITKDTLFFSWMLSLNAIMVILLQPIIYFVVKNLNQRNVVLIGYCIALLFSLVLIFLPINQITIILFVTGITIAEIFIFPTASILVVEITNENYRGIAFGVMDLNNLGNAIGPALGGATIGYLGKYGFYGLICILAAMCILIYLLLCLRPQQKLCHYKNSR